MVGDLRINLGSNEAGINGWINIDYDIRLWIGNNRIARNLLLFFIKHRIIKLPSDGLIGKTPPNYMHFNLEKKNLPFKDNSVAFCYTSHFLEHIKRERAGLLVKDIFRALKPGGVLRVVVPDLEGLSKAYLKSIKNGNRAVGMLKDEYPQLRTATERFNAFFGHFPSDSIKYVSGPYKNISRDSLKFRLVKRLFGTPDHQWMYDYSSLKKLLENVGFIDVTKVSFRSGKTPDVKQLDLESRRVCSIYCEAEKPKV